VAHVSGLQYRAEALSMSTDGVVAAFGRVGAILGRQIGGMFPLALLPLTAGVVHTWRRQPLLCGVLATWASTNIVVTATMNAGWAADQATASLANIDLDAYLLPTLVAACVWVGIGSTVLISHVRSPAARLAVGAIVSASILQPLVANGRTSDRSGIGVARHYVDEVLESVAPGGLLLMRDWNLSSPLMYVQHVERIRPDLVALDLNLMEREWYVDSLSRRHAAVFAPADAERETVRVLGRRWQSDPGVIHRDPAYVASLNSALDELTLALVGARLRQGPVYVTFEVMVGHQGKPDSLASKLAARYQLIPQGLVFELSPDPAFREPDALTLDVEPVLTAARQDGPDAPVAERMAILYRDMLISRGLYLERHDRCPQALDAFALALSIDATSAMADKIRARCQGSR
jgi:hypothetical protein